MSSVWVAGRSSVRVKASNSCTGFPPLRRPAFKLTPLSFAIQIRSLAMAHNVQRFPARRPYAPCLGEANVASATGNRIVKCSRSSWPRYTAIASAALRALTQGLDVSSAPVWKPASHPVNSGP